MICLWSSRIINCFERPNAAEKANRDISSVISGITNDILRECPSLADVGGARERAETRS